VTNVFAVVGEHKKDQARLLLKGDDGGYYAYGSRQGEVIPVRPGKEWTLDSDAKKPAQDPRDTKRRPA
jgi:hypothetical protein